MWEWLQTVLLNSYFAVKVRGQETWIHHLHVKWLSKGHSVDGEQWMQEESNMVTVLKTEIDFRFFLTYLGMRFASAWGNYGNPTCKASSLCHAFSHEIVSKFIQPCYKEGKILFQQIKTIVQITDKTHYWICPFLPSHLALSTPLLGIPVPNNISWTRLCSDISLHQNHTHSQQWEVAVPEAKNKYVACETLHLPHSTCAPIGMLLLWATLMIATKQWAYK